MGSPLVKISNMPFLKNIGLKSKKGGNQSGLSITLNAIASGSSGYFTSSNGVLYTGASVTTPSNVTYQVTASGGTPSYTIQWSSSIAYPGGYATADNLSSFTLATYAGEQDQWTVKVIDSGTPPTTVSASIDTIVFGDDPPSLNVSTVGSDTPSFQALDIYGSTTMPLATIGAAIKYSIPNETTIYVVSGTYAENPLYSKYVIISGSSSPGLGSGNYFVYDTTWTRVTSSAAASRPIFGFTESSFGRIEVTTSGSIQRAIYDVSSSGVVHPRAGVHIVSSSIRLGQMSTNSVLIINGVHVDTGSSASPHNMIPTTILRTPNDQTVMFRAFAGEGSTSLPVALVNLTLDTYPSSSYIRLDSGISKNVWLEMIRFRTIVSGVPKDRYTYSAQTSLTTEWGVTSGAPYEERNIRTSTAATFITASGPIFDLSDAGFSTGRVHHGPYAPWRSSTCTIPSYTNITLDGKMGFWDFAFAQFSASGSRVQRSTNAGLASSTQLSNPGTTTTRPLSGINSNLYRGMAYLDFGGDGVAANDFLVRGPVTTQSTSSIHAFVLFSPRSLTQERGVIFKLGSWQYGYSFVMTGSNVAMTFYSTSSSSPTSASVYMLGGVSTGTQYLAELFFDASSTNKRVGMALYGTASLITSSYFSSTQYPVAEWYLATPTSNDAIGAAHTYYRTMNYIYKPPEADDTGITDYYSGTVGGVFCDHTDVSSSRNVAAHFNKERKQVFDWIWMKYFPTGSYVSHSLFADT